MTSERSTHYYEKLAESFFVISELTTEELKEYKWKLLFKQMIKSKALHLPEKYNIKLRS